MINHDRKRMTKSLKTVAVLSACVLIAMVTLPATSAHPPSRPDVVLLASGLEGGSGSTIGPGGALFVTEGAAGRISKVDPRTGNRTTFATGLPKSIVGIGGAIDVAFIGSTAYALVTLVGPDVGGSDVVGIYRVDGPDSFSIVADIGDFALAQSAEHTVRCSDWSSVRDRNLPRRVPRHRWAP